MKKVSARVFWNRRRPYERLGGKRGSWRIRIGRKLKLKLRFSPKKFLVGIRDAYVNMMLKLASSRVIVGTGCDYGFGGFGNRPLKEYDEKMIVEMYKSMLMAQDHLVNREMKWVN